MSRVAAIDCGTNSLRLLIADTDGVNLTDVVRELEIVRLGQDVDRTGMLAAEALARTKPVLARYARRIRAEAVVSVRMVATSATRDAGNRAEFIAMVRGELGVTPDIVSGEDEARLSFAGASSVLGPNAQRLLVVDIGGGSTELVADVGGRIRSHSMQIGSVRMTERHLHTDPPTSTEVDALVREVDAAIALSRADVPLDATTAFVGVAGTVMTVAAIALGRQTADTAGIHGARISRAHVHEVTDRLLRMTRAERAALPAVHPGRADVIAAGAIVLRTVLDEVGATEVIASEHDVLDGIALELGRS